MPFSRSRSIESMTRSATSWFSRKEPDCQSIASTSVVLPWSTCATIATLRMTMFSIRPLRSAKSWVSTPTYSSGTSTDTRSTGSCTLPSTSRTTTCGLPTVSSNPSRRISSTSTASWSSPRPCTSHASGRSVGTTRSETLPTSSWSSRCLTIGAVSLEPSCPASGEELIPIVIARLGSSTSTTARARASSGSASVSPIVTSGRPATATISPGPASAASTRSSASVT